MKPVMFVRLPLLALLSFLGQRSVHAQVPDWQLREHIVHDTEGGQDVWRDDRITNIPDTTICFIYVGRKQSGPLWLRLQVRYAGYRALYMSRIKFSKGDKSVEFTPAPDLLHHGNNGMMQWEWYDSTPGENEVKVILAIIAEPGVKLTMIGRERTLERELSDTERIAMANMVEQARVLGRVR